jgi:hypothetical protein
VPQRQERRRPLTSSVGQSPLSVPCAQPVGADYLLPPETGFALIQDATSVVPLWTWIVENADRFREARQQRHRAQPPWSRVDKQTRLVGIRDQRRGFQCRGIRIGDLSITVQVEHLAVRADLASPKVMAPVLRSTLSPSMSCTMRHARTLSTR